MRILPRIADPAPPRVARAPAARAPHAGRAGVSTRGSMAAPARARALGSGLLGALAGAAVGAAIAAAAPGVGRTAALQAWPAAVRDGESGPRDGIAAPPVSAVLAPAIEVGVLPAPDPEAARP